MKQVNSGRESGTGQEPTFGAAVRTLIEKRGRIDDRAAEHFLAVGFGKDHSLEMIAVVAASIITNYTGNVTNPPLEAPFQAHAWSA
jgi:hypothetical protein